ncbi:hypothetical protein ACIPQA_26705 [Streptomyces sp. NPDC090109]|uniref:hypothetical protein n=1 Tax=Streptomyces sp. NPDC090109 TaxID=3365948 RepID=UPI0037FAB54F
MTRSVSALLAREAARSASRPRRPEAQNAARSTGTPASAASPSCQETGSSATAITAGSTPLSSGVTR